MYICFREKEEACKELMNTLKYKSSLLEDLESKLAQVNSLFILYAILIVASLRKNLFYG